MRPIDLDIALQMDGTWPGTGTALVTGVSGFVGRHVGLHLVDQGVVVVGLGRGSGIDIRNGDAVAAKVRAARPDVVFHLASAARSAEPEELYSVAVLGTVAVLEAVRQLGHRARVIVMSSSAVYGITPKDRVSEDSPADPLSHYGAAKLAQERIALAYSREAGVDVVIARSFNLLGPGLPRDLACGHFAAGIARAESGLDEAVLRTRGLDSVRDFTDVRDLARALTLLAKSGKTGEAYNISSGTPTRLRRCVDVLIGLATRPVRLESTESAQRQEIDWQVGDAARIRGLTGWRPSIALEQSLRDMLDYERGQVQP
jgi:GDP-4-dehydro-6-deoxy-D-mannose reductase